jgi:hypothetical protein
MTIHLLLREHKNRPKVINSYPRGGCAMIFDTEGRIRRRYDTRLTNDLVSISQKDTLIMRKDDLSFVDTT